MRRVLLAVAAVLLVAAASAGAVWLAKRTVRWNDARTMPPPLEAAVRAYARGDETAGADNVRSFLRRYRAPAWESRARILAAIRAERAGRDSEIVDVLPKDLPAADPLAAHALWLRARGYLARGANDRAAELAQRAAAIGENPFAQDAVEVRARALDARGAWREALGALDAMPSTASASAAARIAAAHGDREGARRRLAGALVASSGPDDAEAARLAFDELIPDVGARLAGTDRARLAAKARAWLDEGRPQAAIDLLRVGRPAGAPSAATPSEALIEAEALAKLGRIDEARTFVARARRGSAEELDGARYVDTKIAAAQGRFGAYRAGLEALGRRGAAPWRQRALLDLAKTLEGVPNASTLEAYRRYRLAAGPQADPLALLREGWAAYELGRTAEADAAFSRALARTDAPGGVRVTATYWRARLAEAAGRSAPAREGYARVADDYANHYYGMLAAKRLARPLPAAPADPGPVDDPARLGDPGRWLAAGRQLVSVGLWDEASPCFRVAARAARREGPAIAWEAAQAAEAAAARSDAIAFAQLAVGDRERTRPQDVPRGLWRLLYPAPDAAAIVRAARDNGLDPRLVAAVALQESAFNPLAVSSAGARGLLQVMPAVGAELARTAGISRFDPADLFDPGTNLRLGCAHLKDYLRRFGALPLALAAYNGGPARVERWALPKGREDDERFVERIPIPETRLYVKRVLAGARLYAIAWPDGLGAE